ncbi:DUF2505 domain-containing protein [Tsukamurella sp. 8F]|uniref:DUF2505 domain-containing protein n=1 Tax=unclassified Tsukamurella TaxID=2633480 RepID=UPI0023B8EB84|nr:MULTISPECIES: DUF2505 domain-containing protein [unclassified Tsukamurella]MDF0528320.1 DUF2505 domain-containing protein [Tsukamurella sp. 8J]MDF0586145.1 DUF2505 domain-containing protein [Tsukamurella sp. 8F]
MATRLERSLDYPIAARALISAYLTEEYWHARVAEVGGEGARVEELAISDGGVQVRVVHTIGEDRLPPVVTAIRPGGLEIHRTESWGPLSESGSTCDFSAKIDGAPAQLSGTAVLEPVTDDSSRITATGSAEVGIPFVAKKVESLVVENLQELMERERDFTVEWVKAH